jgi:quinoprotein glucose dehydrogenase
MFSDGPFTPMPLEGNALLFPSTIGGGNWSGLSVDPKLGYVFTNVMNIGQWGHMEKTEDPKTGEISYKRTSEMGPYARFWNRDAHIPCQNPPFGELVAVNVSTGDIAWKVPLGIIEALEAKGIKHTGSANLGGSIATAGGLLFIGATNDNRFRAFNSKTGKELWVEPIDSSAHSVPITYQGKDGKQYVAVMAGGAGYFGASPNDALIAFTLGNGHRTAKEQRMSNTARVSGTPAIQATALLVQSGPSKLPDGKGRELVERMCRQCHPLDVVTKERHDRAGWSSLVSNMVARGAAGTDAEVRQVIDYLTSHYGS